MDRLRLFPVLLVLVATVLGLWAALVLIGWNLPILFSGFEESHGPLMVNGVLATLIGMERAVAVRRRVALVVPALSGLGAVSLLTPWGPEAGGFLWLASGAGLTALFFMIYRWQPSLHTGIMTVGASLLAVGNLYWEESGAVPWMVLWWVSFLVLLIGAERFELTRILFLTSAKRTLFVVAAGLLVLAPPASLFSFSVGIITAGVGLALLGSWLLLYDIARLNVGMEGKPRFIALCLITGYWWLLMASFLIVVGGPALPGFYNDAFLHSIFLGFVFTMIMAHSMMILESFLGRDVPFSRYFYLPLVLVESTLGLRVFSDVTGSTTLRMWAGLFNAMAIAIFAMMVFLAVIRTSLRQLKEVFHLDSMHIS